MQESKQAYHSQDIDSIYRREKADYDLNREKKKKQKKITVGVLTLILGISVAGGLALISKTERESSQGITVNGTEAFDEDTARHFYLDSREYTLPLTVSVLEEDGWTYSLDTYEEEGEILEIRPEDYRYLTFEKDDQQFNASVQTPASESVPVSEAVVTSVSFYEDVYASGPYGIQVGDSCKQVESALKENGVAYTFYKNTYGKMVYRDYDLHFDVGDSRHSSMYITISCEGNEVYSILESYYD